MDVEEFELKHFFFIVIVNEPKKTLLFNLIILSLRSLIGCLMRVKTSLMLLFMSIAILLLLLLLEAHNLVLKAIYISSGGTLPGQRGMFIMWQNFSLRTLLLCKSCEINASDIFLSPEG